MTVRGAVRATALWHRHLKNVQGGLFAAGVLADGRLVGVALAANPAKVWQGTRRFVIARVATLETKNACSMLYGALCRAGQAIGYLEAWTYTLPEEPGTSLRAAGFEDMGFTDGGEHDRKTRPRKPAVRPDPKRRWRRILALGSAGAVGFGVSV